MSTREEYIEPVPFPQGRLWFGFAAGALAWLLHGFLNVVISASACRGEIYQWTWISAGGLRILLGVVTLALLTVAIVAGAISFRNWRRISELRARSQARNRPENQARNRTENEVGHPEFIHAEGRRREEFMALCGVFVSTVFILGILWGGIPLILIDVCRSAR